MPFKTATLVPLGKLGEFGIPSRMASVIEQDVIDNGQASWNIYRFTMMEDNRIAIEREFTPELSMETRKTNMCAATLDSLKEVRE